VVVTYFFRKKDNSGSTINRSEVDTTHGGRLLLNEMFTVGRSSAEDDDDEGTLA